MAELNEDQEETKDPLSSMLQTRQIDNVEVLLPLATDNLINHLLGQLESLYFALYDEISD